MGLPSAQQLSQQMSQRMGYSENSGLLEDETLDGLEEPPELPDSFPAASRQLHAASPQVPAAMQPTPAPSVFPGSDLNKLTTLEGNVHHDSCFSLAVGQKSDNMQLGDCPRGSSCRVVRLCCDDVTLAPLQLVNARPK